MGVAEERALNSQARCRRVSVVNFVSVNYGGKSAVLVCFGH